VQLDQGHGRKDKSQPQKYPDYVMDGETLYRNITHRAGSEDVASKKMCVLKSLRETVLRENHDAPSAGHVGSQRTIARLAARYYGPGMHRDARDHVRKCENCMRFKPNQMQAAGKMLTQVPEERGPRYVQTSFDPYQDLRTGTKCCWS